MSTFLGQVLEAMREPLEDGIVRISRARGSEVFPAEFILLAAMNPCPCGYLGSKVKDCICRAGDIERYQKKISGPIIDRIDLWVFVQNISYDELSKKSPEEKVSDNMRTKVTAARAKGLERAIKHNTKYKLNKTLSGKELSVLSPLGIAETGTLNRLASQLQISPRAYHRMIRVARTIADLEGANNITDNHIMEAFQYRPKLN